MVSGGESHARPSNALAHPLNTPSAPTGRANNAVVYNRHAVHHIPIFQVNLHAEAASQKCLDVITFDGMLNFDRYCERLRANGDGEAKLDMHAAEAMYKDYKLSFHEQNCTLYNILAKWPGVVDDESLTVCGPGTDWDIDRDGINLYRWLVKPALYDTDDQQRAITKACARVFAIANDSKMASPLPKDLSKEALRRWLHKYLQLIRKSKNHSMPETVYVETCVQLLQRIPSIRSELKVLVATWKQSKTFPKNGNVAIEAIMNAVEDILPCEMELLPVNLALDDDEGRLHNLDGQEQGEVNAFQGRLAPRGNDAARGKPRGPSGDKPPSSVYATREKTNPCRHCRCDGCGNQNPSAPASECSAKNKKIPPLEGASRSRLAFLKDMQKVHELFPGTDLTKVNPRAFIASKKDANGKPFLMLLEDGCDGSDQDSYVCFTIVSDQPDEAPALTALHGDAPGDDSSDTFSLIASIAAVTGESRDAIGSSFAFPSAEPSFNTLQGSSSSDDPHKSSDDPPIKVPSPLRDGMPGSLYRGKLLMNPVSPDELFDKNKGGPSMPMMSRLPLRPPGFHERAAESSTSTIPGRELCIDPYGRAEPPPTRRTAIGEVPHLLL